MRANENFQSTNGLRKESILGIGFMALGMFVFSGVDTLAKLLTANIPPLQLTWFRMLGLVFGIVVYMSLKGRHIFKTSQLKLQIARGVCAVISASLFIYALSYVPLAEAVAVSFVAPFMVTLFAAVLLREQVGVRRWTAILIGFIGTLVIIRPGFDAFHPALLLVVVAAAAFAMRQVLSRLLSSTERTVTTVAYTGLVGSLLLTLPLPFVWQPVQTWNEIYLLFVFAGFAALGELMVIKALEVADTVVVAPVQYTLLIWGTLYGYFVFSQFPDFWTWVGAIIIISSGIYSLVREYRLSKL